MHKSGQAIIGYARVEVFYETSTETQLLIELRFGEAIRVFLAQATQPMWQIQCSPP
jgi:hypothetical protein